MGIEQTIMLIGWMGGITTAATLAGTACYLFNMTFDELKFGGTYKDVKKAWKDSWDLATKVDLRDVRLSNEDFQKKYPGLGEFYGSTGPKITNTYKN